MKVYFIRHGQAKSNIDPATPAIEDGLTELGKSQAEALVARFKEVKPDLIVTSSITRARETADILSLQLGVPAVETSSIREREGYNEILDSHKHLPARDAEQKVRNISSDLEWSIGSNESFSLIKSRLIEAKNYLESLGREHVVVVSHVGFLRAFLGYLVHGESVTEDQCVAFNSCFWINHTGVTTCEYIDNTKRWRIASVNDLAHLSK